MKKLFLFSLAATIFSSCGPAIRVFSDYDKEINVSDYKTYSWLNYAAIEAKATDPLYLNELNDKRIKTAVNKEMQVKGFKPVQEKGELELHYHIIVEDKKSVTTEPYGYNYNSYWQRQRVDIYQYKEGTLIIDLMDKKNNALVWRGWATGAITSETLQKAEENIQFAVHEIFKSFPFSSL